MVHRSAASGTVVVAAAPARAHAEPRSVTPAHRSVQTTAPGRVELTFDQPVNGRPSVDRERVTQPLRPLTGPGRYRVVSVDGHVIIRLRARRGVLARPVRAPGARDERPCPRSCPGRRARRG